MSLPWLREIELSWINPDACDLLAWEGLAPGWIGAPLGPLVSEAILGAILDSIELEPAPRGGWSGAALLPQPGAEPRPVGFSARAAVPGLGEGALTLSLWDRGRALRAEAALSESEASHRRVQRFARVGHWDCEVRGNKISWSQEMLRLLGLEGSQDDVTLGDLGAILVAEDRLALREAILRSWAEPEALPGQPVHGGRQNVRLKLNGELRHLDVRWQCFVGEGGSLAHVRGTAMDVTAFVRAQAELSRSEALYRTLVDNVPDGVVALFDRDTVCVVCGGVDLERFGFRAADLIGAPAAAFIPEPACAQICERLRLAFEGEAQAWEERHAGRIYTLRAAAVRVGERGAAEHCLLFVRDITRSRQAAERLKASVREKEVLLKEVYHRVKNNLQVVVSLLRLQGRHAGEPKLTELLQESEGRISAMALVHEQLYASEDLARIDFGAYVGQLMGNLHRALGAGRPQVKLHWALSPVSLGIASAIPCGLIVHELVTNALRHAFAPDEAGEVRVSLTCGEDGWVKLAVQDTGVGLPEAVEGLVEGSLGLKLVDILADQLGAELLIASQGGTTFTLTFKESR